GTDYIYYGSTEIRGMHTNELLDVREKVETMVDGELRIKFQKKNIFPEYYIISVNRYPDIVKEDIDEWIYMMKNNIVKTEFHSRNIDKAREKLKILNMSEQERLDYEKYLMNSAIEKDVISTARIEGRAEGRTEGKAEGKAEEKLETTINCIKAGLSNETIQKVTGLSLDEIQKIREGLEN
ncbi:MAG: hypothetical protein KDK45_15955, partial [Leptospiraceae bacterium]|nr:hypothetical protein [Leptospiraceae bacterium]